MRALEFWNFFVILFWKALHSSLFSSCLENFLKSSKDSGNEKECTRKICYSRLGWKLFFCALSHLMLTYSLGIKMLVTWEWQCHNDKTGVSYAFIIGKIFKTYLFIFSVACLLYKSNKMKHSPILERFHSHQYPLLFNLHTAVFNRQIVPNESLGRSLFFMLLQAWDK